MNSVVQSRQESLDITHGPVFTVDYFEKGAKEPVILFTAHHLVIDLVSWRILWHDLEQLLNGAALPLVETSFREWTNIQQRLGYDSQSSPSLPFKLEYGFDFWGVKPTKNIFAAAETHRIHLDETMTSLLLVQAPIQPDTSITDTVKFVKDIRRQMVGKGLPYFASQHQEKINLSETDVNAPFLFNYGGVFQQLEQKDSLFRQLEADIVEVAPSARRIALVEIDGSVIDGKMHLSVSIHRDINHYKLLRQWAYDLKNAFHTAAHFLNQQDETPTLSDFPLVTIPSYGGLNSVVAQLAAKGISIKDVARLLPCTPIQEGILFGMAKESASYHIIQVWKCSSLSHSEQIDPTKLEASWRAALSRHSIFSMVFLESVELGGFLQVQLQDAPLRIQCVHSGTNCPAVTLVEMERPFFSDREPPYLITICQSSSGEIGCRIDIDHTLIDAVSFPVVLSEVVDAYSRNSDRARPHAPGFHRIVKEVLAVSPQMKLEYWKSYLAGIKPCSIRATITSDIVGTEGCQKTITLPCLVTDRIDAFCRAGNITRSTFLQVSWAIVLAQLTNKQDVCFGYLTSGRDIPVEGIEEIVGPLINMLISRIDLGSPASNVIENTGRDLLEHFNYQHLSLAKLQSELGLHGQQLFDTILTVRQAQNVDKAGRLNFQDFFTHDPNEFCIAINVELNGASTHVQLVYQNDSVETWLAQEVVEIFQSAISFLLDDGPEIGENSLHDAFFNYRSGGSRSQAEITWKNRLRGLEAAQFPTLLNPSTKPKLDSTIELKMEGISLPGTDSEMTAVIWTAWAFLVAGYTYTNDIIFGGTISSSDAAFTSMDPTAVSMPPIVPVMTARQGAETIYNEISQFRRINRHWIRQLGDEQKQACDLQTLLQVEKAERSAFIGSPTATSESYSGFSLRLNCSVRDDSLDLKVWFDSAVLTMTQVRRISHQFENLIRQFHKNELQLRGINDIHIASRADLADIQLWNGPIPQSSSACIHDLFAATAAKQPDTLAICSWDGEFTYKELDNLSTRLACCLAAMGARTGTIIPLCFEKGKWTSVAILGIMKTGAASVLMDSGHPEARLRTIIQQAHSNSNKCFILASKRSESLASRLRLGLHSKEEVTLVIADNLSQTAKNIPKLPTEESQPDSLLYVVFTSGSTGTPKGAMVTHKNFSSAIYYYRSIFGFKQTSRVLDFASYAFDVAWFNILHTLTAGGCLCIPTKADLQNNLSGCIQDMRVSFAAMTPMVWDLLGEQDLESFESIIFTGERLAPLDSKYRRLTASIFNAYGPAECSVINTYAQINQNDTKEPSIGKGWGVITWIVRLDGSAIAAIGEIGELWVEGPLVGHGYLGDAEKTTSTFVEDPSWLLPRTGVATGPNRRVYRSGDLVRYNSDGSIQFIGRKDDQVKIRGQRVELGDIEAHIKKLLASEPDVQVVAEIISPRESSFPVLAAFVCPARNDQSLEVTVSDLTKDLNEKLLLHLPLYMVPTIYVPISPLPVGLTGKINRKELRQIGKGLSLATITDASNAPSLKSPLIGIELVVANVWAEVLGLSLNSISRDIPFIRLGGDSITAMQVISRLRVHKVYLTRRLLLDAA
ncbi:unnamed protein product [Clonostachys rosea]|uniref:Carrier domain-containing protein n=1 Tax=Bionectria ochroleuca TaxID=29856 RepID=A0ABY6U5I7_BIOOC|nr:unnamed protein product [Clonostachys rosea]